MKPRGTSSFPCLFCTCSSQYLLQRICKGLCFVWLLVFMVRTLMVKMLFLKILLLMKLPPMDAYISRNDIMQSIFLYSHWHCHVPMLTLDCLGLHNSGADPGFWKQEGIGKDSAPFFSPFLSMKSPPPRSICVCNSPIGYLMLEDVNVLRCEQH